MKPFKIKTPFCHKKQRKKGSLTGLAFLLPSLLGVAVFVLIPFGDAARRSLYTAMGGQFVGLQNYVSLFQNKAFRLAGGNTLRFMAACIPALVLFSLILALILHRRPKTELYKTTFLVPMAVPVASVVLIWQAVFHRSGFLNAALAAIGAAPVDFMQTDSAFWVLVFSYIWKNMGYNMVLWLAGLANVDQSQYEAARIDGAGPWRCFWHITMPNMLPTLFTITVLSLLNSFKVFREAYLIAGDYPHSSIYMLQHLFNNWFVDLNMDKLCAAAVVVAAVVICFILLLQKAWVKEE